MNLRDQAVQQVDARAGHTIEFCWGCSHHLTDDKGHAHGYDDETHRLILEHEFETPSGRRWRPRGEIGDSEFLMMPRGSDVRPAQTRGRMYGGVRSRWVEVSRLEGFDKTWKPIEEK